MLLSKKHIGNFQKWRSKLESLGYTNHVQCLNAKNYGIPQNRERVFMVSLLGEWFYEFPKKQKLEKRLKDMLEENVDEKYYLSNDMMKYFMPDNSGGGSSKREQVNTNRTQFTQGKEMQDASMRVTTSTQSKLSKTIRSGGRGSTDRHQWDVICEKI